MPPLTYLLMPEAYWSTGSYPWRKRRNWTWSVYFAVAIACLSISFLLMSLDTLTAIGAVAGIGVFITSFVSTQAGLYIIVFSMLLSPEIGVGSLGGGSEALARRGVTIRAEDLLLIVLGFAWVVRAALYKQSLSRDSPLNRPILYYVAMCLFATIAGLMAGSVYPARHQLQQRIPATPVPAAVSDPASLVLTVSDTPDAASRRCSD